MSSAPFVYRDDGQPDWGTMWKGFCELALYGGPPHRAPADALQHAGGRAGEVVEDRMIEEIAARHPRDDGADRDAVAGRLAGGAVRFETHGGVARAP